MLKTVLRILVLLIALALFICYSVFPSSVTHKMGGANMLYIVLSLIGMCLAFIYGIGFVPNSKILRLLTNPLLALALLLVPFIILQVH